MSTQADRAISASGTCYARRSGMNTYSLKRVAGRFRQIPAMAGAAMLLAASIAVADVAESVAGQFRGIYKVVA